MNNWIDYFYSFILGAAMLLSAMGLWFVAIMPSTDAWSKKFFRCYFLVLLIGCSSTLFEFYIQYHQVPVAAIYLFVILECLFLSMPLPMITLYLRHLGTIWTGFEYNGTHQHRTPRNTPGRLLCDEYVIISKMLVG